MLEGFVDVEYSLEHGHVYVLMYEGTVVYVGQTTNIYARLQVHRRNFRFDRALVKTVRRNDLLSEEARYISELKPVLNVQTPLVYQIPVTTVDLAAALDKLSYDPERAKKQRAQVRRKKR